MEEEEAQTVRLEILGFNNLTLAEWFHYLELHLPKQIIHETEEMIDSMTQKARDSSQRCPWRNSQTFLYLCNVSLLISFTCSVCKQELKEKTHTNVVSSAKPEANFCGIFYSCPLTIATRCLFLTLVFSVHAIFATSIFTGLTSSFTGLTMNLKLLMIIWTLGLVEIREIESEDYFFTGHEMSGTMDELLAVSLVEAREAKRCLFCEMLVIGVCVVLLARR
ncbi:hypothetical protein Fmac_023764 [Flemingia macrophylla]|uniref:Uncharacterized protein n=1 Tax=Flemingia macrophylla TaxID=520843 RepID=A0ABD1LMI2_9FABA